MPFSIDRVVPWGRTFAEYQAMFDLSAADLCRRIHRSAVEPVP